MVTYKWSTRGNSVFLIICTFIIYAHSDVPRPRGVSLSKASLYTPAKDFTCFDGTVTIPYHYVNDDYCDCFDGSDEPGTSACLNGIFHCTNAGHRPLNIPSSRINDGVCDCCDGTDEYATPDTCSNICEDLGKEAKAEAQRIVELYKAGSHLRQEFVEKGFKKRNEMAEQLEQLEKDKVEAEAIKAEKEAYKNEVEVRENEALQVYRDAEALERQKKDEQEKATLLKESTDQFNKYDSNSDGELTRDEINVVNVFDKDKDGQVDDEEFQYFFGEKQTVDKEAFGTSVWPLLKSFLMMEQGMFRPEDTEQADNEPEVEADEASDSDVEYAGNDDDNSDLDLPQDEGEEHEPEPDRSTTYDEETQKLVNEATDARQQLTEAERSVRGIESNIKNIQQNLEKDYGLHQEFATLDGECFEFQDKEYIYKVCMFQKVTQKSKNGGAEVGLGNWGEWAGGENRDNNKYSAMKYTNGMSCWNGPQRSALVNINCGLETKLLSVTEPYRCEYKIELTTPAACDEANASQHHSSHDEL